MPGKSQTIRDFTFCRPSQIWRYRSDLNRQKSVPDTPDIEFGQPRPQGAFPNAREKRPGDEVGIWRERMEGEPKIEICMLYTNV